MAEGSSRFTFGRALIAALLVLAIAAAILFWVQRQKSQYYDALLERTEALLASSRLIPRETVPAAASSAPLPPDSKPRIYAVMDGRQTVELRYFDQQQLYTVEKLDNGGRVARRDIYDGGRVRVRQYFNEQRELVRRVDQDEHGREVAAKLFVPIAGIRAGY